MWLAQHSTIKKMGRPHRLNMWSMGKEQCTVVVSLLKLMLKLWSSNLEVDSEQGRAAISMSSSLAVTVVTVVMGGDQGGEGWGGGGRNGAGVGVGGKVGRGRGRDEGD